MADPCLPNTYQELRKGLFLQRNLGVVAGFPCINFKVNLIDGAMMDSSVMAFEIALGLLSRRYAQLTCSPEPVMKVEVVTPEDYKGDIIGDLNSRRGQVGGMDTEVTRVVDAMVPLENMFGYVNNLRSMSQGRAQFTQLIIMNKFSSSGR